MRKDFCRKIVAVITTILFIGSPVKATGDSSDLVKINPSVTADFYSGNNC